MEFWGAEVKPGKVTTVKPEEGTRIHVSQASVQCQGEKGESAVLCVTVDQKESVIGTLSQEEVIKSQICFDLAYEKEFKLSHNLKNGSVFFLGYKSPIGPADCASTVEIDSRDNEQGLTPMQVDTSVNLEKRKPAATPQPQQTEEKKKGGTRLHHSQLIKVERLL